MEDKTDRAPAEPTGRRYDSVRDLMIGESIPAKVQEKALQIEKDTRVVSQLALLRQKVGITQEQMAKHLEVTQSAISKFESGNDDDITIRFIREYARATKQNISITLGKPLNHVEAVKVYALGIKGRLEALATIANQNEALEKDIKGFFGEAFFNILTILATCSDKLRKNTPEFEVRFEATKSESSMTGNV